MEIRIDVYRFRRATESDFTEIADLFARHDYGIRRLEWLEWKYVKNPDGPALIYVTEDADNRIVSLFARLPRRFMGKKTAEFSVFQSVDLFTTPGHRRKKLHKRLSDFAKSERDYFLIGFPNELSHNVAELDHVIPLEDWIFPLALSKENAIKRLRLLAPLADIVSKMYAFALLGPIPKDLHMKPLTKFERDFEMDGDFIHGLRSAAYLNWRFIYNPIRRYSVFEFVDKETNIGYCVYAVSKSAAEIYDLVCNRLHRECIRLLVEHCRSRNLTHLNFRGANLRLGRFGFFRRPSTEDCITTDIPDGLQVPQGPWMLTLADRDV